MLVVWLNRDIGQDDLGTEMKKSALTLSAFDLTSQTVSEMERIAP